MKITDLMWKGYFRAMDGLERAAKAMKRRDGQSTVEWTMIVGALATILILVLKPLRMAIEDAFFKIVNMITEIFV